MRPTRSKSLIVDIYGAFLRDLGGWIAIADLVRLMGDLGVDEHAVRSSVSRMSRKGLLHRSPRNGQITYGLSKEAETILAEGDLRIFNGMQPADLAEGWVLAVFSIPEGKRNQRHQLRSQLTWLGFGALGRGVWIAPARTLPMAEEAIRQLGLEVYVDLLSADYEGFGDIEQLVRRAWDIDALNALYREFLDDVRPLLRRWHRRSESGWEREAFVDYITVLHQWRKMPYLDPGLPPQLLLREWQGQRAADLFRETVDLLEGRARAHVEAVAGKRRGGRPRRNRRGRVVARLDGSKKPANQ